MKYQTGSKKVDTESEITLKQLMITQINQHVEGHEKELENMKDKIKKLEEKEQDASGF